jgi:rhodanese-related sulfurtransferase
VVDYSEIDVRALHGLGTDARIIDVREPDEWASGHIPHAVHVPLQTVPDRTAAFDGATAYVVCRSGGRSRRVCEYLAAQGFDVVNVSGGMLAWAEAGFEIDVGASE